MRLPTKLSKLSACVGERAMNLGSAIEILYGHPFVRNGAQRAWTTFDCGEIGDYPFPLVLDCL